MAERPILRRRQWLLTRDFSLVWWSQVLSQVADGVSKLALLWFVYSITGSALQTTVIGLLQTLPPIVLGPVIGVVVDRLPKKAILICSDLARGLLIGLIPCWVSVESFTVQSLYVLTFAYRITHCECSSLCIHCDCVQHTTAGRQSSSTSLCASNG